MNISLTVYSTRQCVLLWFNVKAAYYSGDQIKDKEMGEACSVYEGEEKYHTGFWVGNLQERYHLEDQGWESLDSINLA
jgi:hypothetical protein